MTLFSAGRSASPSSRRVATTLAPARQAATRSGSSSGGCSKSASITITARPRACSKSRAQRFLMAEIAGEREIANVRIGDRSGANGGERAVCGAVIDEYDLVAAKRLQDVVECRRHARDIAGLVIGRQHHRNIRDRFAHRCVRCQSICDHFLRRRTIHLCATTVIDWQGLAGHSCAAGPHHRARPGVAYYDGCMDARTTTADDDCLGAIVEFCAPQPGQTLAIVLGAHFRRLDAAAASDRPNLELDLAEDLALGKEWQLGYWKHPPLPWWLADLVYRLTGQIEFGLRARAARGDRLFHRGLPAGARHCRAGAGADRHALAGRHPLLQLFGGEIRP